MNGELYRALMLHVAEHSTLSASAFVEAAVCKAMGVPTPADQRNGKVAERGKTKASRQAIAKVRPGFKPVNKMDPQVVAALLAPSTRPPLRSAPRPAPALAQPCRREGCRRLDLHDEGDCRA